MSTLTDQSSKVTYFPICVLCLTGELKISLTEFENVFVSLSLFFYSPQNFIKNKQIAYYGM